MFLVRVILLSYVAFTVTSAACCGEENNQCQDDCTGIVCTEDSHCGDQCCIGAITYLFKGYCGACHKTRNCQFLFSGGFCREKCCGSDDMQCLKTCVGLSCKSDDHCDGECCIGGDLWNKTCAPCPKKPTRLPTTEAVSVWTRDNRQCSRNLDCKTNCCKFGTCYPKGYCSSSAHRPSSIPIASIIVLLILGMSI